MNSHGHPLDQALTASLSQVTVPDLWQQEAVSALRAGEDVVVHAPTGAGKTLVFESWSNFGKPRGQAIYTVPTRALANDKLAEWRSRGWNVGIATGDLSDNLDAPVIVATLETQKNRLIRGEGPTLLVVDEYQMLADEDRGLNYELAIAMAPAGTQLLLLSGSVANPQDIVHWLTRLGRRARLVRHDERPVPLEEVFATSLNFHLPAEVRGYWPRLAARALAENLGPILIFAPRRAAAEELAAELARYLPPPPVPLALSAEQKVLVGESLARLISKRVAFHHSGLSYGARAGVLEPLAKAGALRVVVATMGLAAGINFSLRSVALAGDSYRRDHAEHPLRPDEILQMFGRAGRRGIDETGYVLVSTNEIRLRDSHPAHLSRSGMVDWNALLGVMHAAAEAGRDPFAEAVRIQQRLFTTKPVVLGVEQALRHPEVPCGLHTDAERARHVRHRVRQFLNSRGEWEKLVRQEERPVKEIQIVQPLHPLPKPLPAVEGTPPNPPPEATIAPADNEPLAVTLRPALTEAAALDKLGHGGLKRLPDGTWCRSQIIGEIINGPRVQLAKWVRKLTNWNTRHTSTEVWENDGLPLLRRKLAAQKFSILRIDLQPFGGPGGGESTESAVESGDDTTPGTTPAPAVAGPGLGRLVALISVADLPLRVAIDSHGVALWRPPNREVIPPDCTGCALMPTCQTLPTATGVAMLWRRLGLVDASGRPTRRGRIMSFFHLGDGLAIAAGLEDEAIPLEDLIYEIANLHAGFRFAGDNARWAGRIAMASQRLFGLQSIAGYLEHGLPAEYGAGADEVARAIHADPLARTAFVTPFLGIGDIDRAIIEWRSLLRQVSHSPPLEWDRWTALQSMARAILDETESPTLIDLPPLSYQQARRMEHTLVLRRH